MIDWIRDAETGELYLVESDFNFEPPSHLEIPEYQTVDYDKTRQMTITELQNQLIAAQNHIEAIENEKTSDNNSIETVNDVSAEIVSCSEKRLNVDVNYEGKSNSFDFFASLKFVGVILLLCFVFALGIYVFPKLKDIEINIPNIFEQQIVEYELTPIPEIGSISIYSSDEGMPLYLNRKAQEQPQERQETVQDQSEIDVFQKCINFALRFLSIILTILWLKFGIGFLMNVLRGS